MLLQVAPVNKGAGETHDDDEVGQGLQLAVALLVSVTEWRKSIIKCKIILLQFYFSSHIET